MICAAFEERRVECDSNGMLRNSQVINVAKATSSWRNSTICNERNQTCTTWCKIRIYMKLLICIKNEKNKEIKNLNKMIIGNGNELRKE